MEEMSKRTTHDRISTLPDCLLHYILSSLVMKDVVKTSVLSKRWQYIWTSVPKLKFICHYSTKEDIDVFVAWVNRVILCFQNTSVENFVLNCPYLSGYDMDIDMWVRFVANKYVKDLRLDFHIPEWVTGDENVCYSKSYEQYTLPKDVLCNSSLTSLCVSVCNVVSYGDFRLTCLKKISFDRVNLQKDVIAGILSASPMLVYLEIRACHVSSQLVINSERLRELVIAHNDSDEETEPSMEISAPALLSFHLFGEFHHLHKKNHPLISMASLQRAELCYGYYDDDEDVDDDDDDDDDGGGGGNEGHGFEIKRVVYLGELLLERLKHVVELEMGFQCIQTMLFLEAKGLQSPLLGLKHLKLNAKINRNNVPGIVTLLRCSPNLEKLVVNQSFDSEDWEESLSFPKFIKKVESYWMCKRLMEEVPLSHLKSVKFMGYKKWGDVNETTHTFVQLLFKNAKLLPNVVINMEEYEVLLTPHSA